LCKGGKKTCKKRGEGVLTVVFKPESLAFMGKEAPTKKGGGIGESEKNFVVGKKKVPHGRKNATTHGQEGKNSRSA